MSNLQEKKGLAEKMVPLLVAEQLKDAGGEVNDALRTLLNELLQEQLENFQKEKARKLCRDESAIQAVKENAEQRAAEKARCNHRKKNGQPRTGGQKLSNGQLCILCTYCQKEWFMPPNKELGQEACPRELMPDPDTIGG